MPYIETKTNVTLTDKQKRELKEELGKAIEAIPGKSEQWLMLGFTDGMTMAFRGDAEAPCAMIEVALFGSADAAAYDALTEILCDKAARILGVPSARIYVKYTEHDRWGFNGFNF